MSSSRSRSSSGPVPPNYSVFSRSLSPSGRFAAAAAAAGGRGGAAPHSSYFASSSSSFSSSTFFHRSTSPSRVHFAGATTSPTASVRFSLDNRPTSPGRSISFVPAKKAISSSNSNRKTCMCSPTNHPGSFRCSLHKGFGNRSHHQQHAMSSSSTRLNARRSAMTNSLVRIGTVEGDLVKRALAALIRPSSHQQRRREAFQPRPSRLSVMSKADDL